MIITIGRQCGSNGLAVGEKLAQMYQLPLYDRKSMIALAKEAGIYEKMPNFFAEKPVNSILYAIAAGEEMTDKGKVPLESLRNMIGDQSCILIGRCANYVFRDRPDCVSVFLHGSLDCRIQCIMERKGIDAKEAKKLVEKTDRKRSSFHEFYSSEEWGMAEGYDLSINSGRLGITETVKLIRSYVEGIR